MALDRALFLFLCLIISTSIIHARPLIEKQAVTQTAQTKDSKDTSLLTTESDDEDSDADESDSNSDKDTQDSTDSSETDEKVKGKEKAAASSSSSDSTKDQGASSPDTGASASDSKASPSADSAKSQYSASNSAPQVSSEETPAASPAAAQGNESSSSKADAASSDSTDTSGSSASSTENSAASSSSSSSPADTTSPSAPSTPASPASSASSSAAASDNVDSKKAEGKGPSSPSEQSYDEKTKDSSSTASATTAQSTDTSTDSSAKDSADASSDSSGKDSSSVAGSSQQTASNKVKNVPSTAAGSSSKSESSSTDGSNAQSKSKVEKNDEGEGDADPSEDSSEEVDQQEQAPVAQPYQFFMPMPSPASYDAIDEKGNRREILVMAPIATIPEVANADAQQRQILTYPATGKGWSHSQQWGPAHLYNHDYPYFAYGYSWGCGHHVHGDSHGYVKSEIEKGKKRSHKKSKDKKHMDGTSYQCRDFIVMPRYYFPPQFAPYQSPFAPIEENAQSRGAIVNNDIACGEEDNECAAKQVIGSMAGGSLFGDGMGGLGIGFPGVPGIHTGVSGYNMGGGLGEHHMGSSGGHHGGFGGNIGGGFGGGFGEGGGGGIGGGMGGHGGFGGELGGGGGEHSGFIGGGGEHGGFGGYGDFQEFGGGHHGGFGGFGGLSGGFDELHHGAIGGGHHGGFTDGGGWGSFGGDELAFGDSTRRSKKKEEPSKSRDKIPKRGKSSAGKKKFGIGRFTEGSSNGVVDPAGWGNFPNFHQPLNYYPGMEGSLPLGGVYGHGDYAGWRQGWGDFDEHQYGGDVGGWGHGFGGPGVAHSLFGYGHGSVSTEQGYDPTAAGPYGDGYGSLVGNGYGGYSHGYGSGSYGGGFIGAGYGGASYGLAGYGGSRYGGGVYGGTGEAYGVPAVGGYGGIGGVGGSTGIGIGGVGGIGGAGVAGVGGVGGIDGVGGIGGGVGGVGGVGGGIGGVGGVGGVGVGGIGGGVGVGGIGGGVGVGGIGGGGGVGGIGGGGGGGVGVGGVPAVGVGSAGPGVVGVGVGGMGAGGAVAGGYGGLSDGLGGGHNVLGGLSGYSAGHEGALYSVGHGVIGQGHLGYDLKSKTPGSAKAKSSAKKKDKTAHTRQDIAMPDEQSLIDVQNQRQLIGSLGASTLFADNVGGMGLGHPGVPQMSSGVSGIPGEYGGHGGFSHGWEGEAPIHHLHGHGFHNGGGGVGGGGEDGFGFGGHGGGEMGGHGGGYGGFESNFGGGMGGGMGGGIGGGMGGGIGGGIGGGMEGGMGGGMGHFGGGYARSETGNQETSEAAQELESPTGLPTKDTQSFPDSVAKKGKVEESEREEKSEQEGGSTSSAHPSKILDPRPLEDLVDDGFRKVRIQKPAKSPKKRTSKPSAAKRVISEKPSKRCDFAKMVHGVRANIKNTALKYLQLQKSGMLDECIARYKKRRKLSEIRKLVHEVSASLKKTDEKLVQLKKNGKKEKRQITPAFTPVTSEPVGVPDIRYPVPSADRYPLGAGYVWPSANYGHQYGGPYAWSRSTAPSQQPAGHKKRSITNEKGRKANKRQEIHPFFGGHESASNSVYGYGLGLPISGHGYGGGYGGDYGHSSPVDYAGAGHGFGEYSGGHGGYSHGISFEHGAGHGFGGYSPSSSYGFGGYGAGHSGYAAAGHGYGGLHYDHGLSSHAVALDHAPFDQEYDHGFPDHSFGYGGFGLVSDHGGHLGFDHSGLEMSTLNPTHMTYGGHGFGVDDAHSLGGPFGSNPLASVNGFGGFGASYGHNAFGAYGHADGGQLAGYGSHFDQGYGDLGFGGNGMFGSRRALPARSASPMGIDSQLPMQAAMRSMTGQDQQSIPDPNAAMFRQMPMSNVGSSLPMSVPSSYPGLAGMKRTVVPHSSSDFKGKAKITAQGQ